MKTGNAAEGILNLDRYLQTSWYDGLLADFDVYRRHILVACFAFGLLMPFAVAIVSLGKGEIANLFALGAFEILLACGLAASLRASRKTVGIIAHAVLSLYPLTYLLTTLSPWSHRSYMVLLVAMPPIAEALSPRREKLMWLFYSSAFIVFVNLLPSLGFSTSWVRDFSAGEIVIAHAATTIVAALSYLSDRQMIHYLEAQAQRIIRDEATGLPTAAALGEALKAMDESIVCVVSIDNFYELSALFGYEFGDEIVRKAASRLSEAVQRLGGRCFRLHGRDLGVVRSAFREDEIQASNYVLELRAALGEPMELKGRRVEIQCSIGYTFCRDRNAIKALNEAGGAIWRGAKSHGVYRHETPLDSSAVELSFSRLATLSRCIREGGLEAFFQPVVSLSDGRRAWYEMLLRVRGEGGRLEPPLVYLELARSTGYWDAITDFIVSRALDRLRSGCGSVSINIGTEDIGREAFRRAAAEAAALARERGCDFILELLETDSSDLSEEHFAVLRELRAAGCLIAIDDFGTGYSNYSRLLSFPVDIVKFDMSLARRAFGEPAVEELLAGLVKFCSGLGIITVVEGLESEEEVRRFTEMGLDFGQGYFWSPAVPSHEAPPSPPGRIRPRSP